MPGTDFTNVICEICGQIRVYSRLAMRIINAILYSLTKKERIIIVVALVMFLSSSLIRSVIAVQENTSFVPVQGGAYREGIVGQPAALNPIISHNPIDQDISALLYSKLSDLTAGISVENEGKTYVAKLREGLIWDDGRPLTSDDVLFTMRTIQNLETNSPIYKNWQGVLVERISELQIKFTLPAPYVFFENNLSRLPIIPKHIFGTIPISNLRLSSYNLEPVGSGPYKVLEFKRRKDGFITEYHLVVNEDFSGEPPFIKDFYFKFFEDEGRLIEAFKLRQVDGFGDLSLASSEVFELPNAVIKKIAMPRYYSVFFNPRATSMLEKLEFRRALSSVINKVKLVKDALRGEAQVINGPFEDGADAISSEEENPRETIESLKEERSLVISLIIPEVDFIEKVAEFVEKEWEDAGIDDVIIISLESEDFFNTVIRERNYEAVIFGNVFENPLDLFPFWHSSERFYPGLNLALYSNEHVDTAIENIRQMENPSERQAEFDKAMSIIKENSSAAFLFTLPYTYVYNERLRGFNVGDEMFVVPADRFRGVNSWYVKKARVFR